MNEKENLMEGLGAPAFQGNELIDLDFSLDDIIREVHEEEAAGGQGAFSLNETEEPPKKPAAKHREEQKAPVAASRRRETPKAVTETREAPGAAEPKAPRRALRRPAPRQTTGEKGETSFAGVKDRGETAAKPAPKQETPETKPAAGAEEAAAAEKREAPAEAPRRKKKKVKKLSPLAAGLRVLMLPLTVIYLEGMLRVTSGISGTFSGIFLIALAVGLGLAAVANPWKQRKVTETVTIVLAELFTVWYLECYFTNASYFVFMGPVIAAQEATNLVSEFGGNLMTVLTHGIGWILLYHLPVAAIVFLGTKKGGSVFSLPMPGRWLTSAVLCLLSLMIFYDGVACNYLHEELRRQYTVDYSYDSAVRKLGVITSFGLELKYGLSKDGNAAQLEGAFDISAGGEKIDWTAENTTPGTTAGGETAGTPTVIDPETGVSDPQGGETGTETGEPVEETGTQAPVIQKTGYNALNIDFDKLIADTSDNALKDVFRYVSSLTPTKRNEYTGLFAGKNLILICAESFTKEVIDPDRTPTLYRMANQGIVFEDFYVPFWSGSTSTGEYEFLTGNIPTQSDSMKATAGAGYNMYYTMGNALNRLGYFGYAMHNGTNTYYSRDITHYNLGYSDWLAYGSGMEDYITWQWPASDEEMAANTLDLYLDHQPFSCYYLTISGHFNYTFNGNQMAMKNRSVTEGLPYMTTTKSYIAAQQEIENMLRVILERLEEAGIADDTVIVLCADHYPYGLEKSDSYGNSNDYLADLYGFRNTGNQEGYHNQAIIWCGSLEKEDPIVISTPSSAIDLVPTLLNLFGVEYDSRLLAGHDLLSDADPLVIFNDHSWKSDKGYYSAYRGKFTPAEGVVLDDVDAYVAEINKVVSNKFTFSKAVIAYDFYGKIFGKKS